MMSIPDRCKWWDRFRKKRFFENGREKNETWKEVWKSKTSRAKFGKKTFFLLQFYIKVKAETKHKRSQVRLYLWIKDLYTPGKPLPLLQSTRC